MEHHSGLDGSVSAAGWGHPSQSDPPSLGTAPAPAAIPSGTVGFVLSLAALVPAVTAVLLAVVGFVLPIASRSGFHFFGVFSPFLAVLCSTGAPLAAAGSLLFAIPGFLLCRQARFAAREMPARFAPKRRYRAGHRIGLSCILLSVVSACLSILYLVMR